MKTLTNSLKVLIVLFALALFPFIATAQDVNSKDAKSVDGVMENVSSGDEMEVLTIAGVISLDEEQLILDTGLKSYIIYGQVDDAFIGKEVIATGTMAENEGKKVFKLQLIKAVE